jgi:hypothetical protein
MSVNEFDITELLECQSERNRCGNCKNWLCKFNPLVSADDEGSTMVMLLKYLILTVVQGLL